MDTDGMEQDQGNGNRRKGERECGDKGSYCDTVVTPLIIS